MKFTSTKGLAPLITIIIVLIIALLAAGGIAGYTLIKNKQPNKETTSTTIVPSTTITLVSTTATTKPSILYKTVYDDGTLTDILYKSVDGGKHWTEISAQYKGKILFAFDPKNPNLIYKGETGFNMMAEGDGVHISKNIGGKAWTVISNGIITETKRKTGILMSVSSLRIDPNDSNIIYVTVDGENFKSIDGGNNWIKL